jgi:DNA-binding CsgD family transcriptional regulator
VLSGRTSELKLLGELIQDVRAGQSRALVITGEAGIGKSALLEHLAAGATGCRVATAAGLQAEAELAFAALHRLCAPVLEYRDRIPEPQRDALSTIFGLRASSAPDAFLLGLSVLSLLGAAAAERPLVCVVDDAQWVDIASAQVLGLVARRLMAESVALVFARRHREEVPSLAGIPELVVGGLPSADAHALLAAAVRGPMDQRILDRIVAETRGNPLAILELPRGLTYAELADGTTSGAGGLSGRIEDSFRRRLAQLAPDERRLLILAAAEPLGDPVVLWRAAQRLGIPAEAADSESFVGLVQWGPPVAFRHPLVRSATYQSATAEERRAVHRVLAEVTDPVLEADRRAWHLARAPLGTDDAIADELERSAGRARARGGFAASAAFLERAAALTVDPAARAVRTLASAEDKYRAGTPEPALRLLATAEAGPLDELTQARVDRLRAQIAYAQNRGDEAPALLLRAARRLEPLDLRLARDTYLDALAAAQFAGRLVPGGVVAAAKEARAARPASARRPADILLDGTAVMITDGYGAGVPVLRQALARFRADDIADDDTLRWGWLACRAAIELWDHDGWQDVADRMVRLARSTGALTTLPIGLMLQMGARIYAGDLASVTALDDELNAITEATGSHIAPYGALLRFAWRGRETEASSFIESAIDGATARGEGMGVTAALMARAVLYNGLGRHAEALGAAERGSEHFEDLAYGNQCLVELVEAASHCRQLEQARNAVERLAAWTSGSDWALGIEARCRALVSDGAEAERLHRQAVSLLGRTRVRVEAARAHLLYGEWLRRERRRLDAREQLRQAHDMFTAMGVEAFAERSRRELVATGERARKRTVVISGQLTSREAQIARLARDGLTNPEIGTRLFLSPRTVEYHLGNIFAKLGITSRVELGRALTGPPQDS